MALWSLSFCICICICICFLDCICICIWICICKKIKKYHASPGVVILGRSKDWHWLVLFVLLGANDSGSKANSSPCWSFCFYNWRIFLWESFTEKPLKYNCLGLNLAPEDAYMLKFFNFYFFGHNFTCQFREFLHTVHCGNIFVTFFTRFFGDVCVCVVIFFTNNDICVLLAP